MSKSAKKTEPASAAATEAAGTAAGEQAAKPKKKRLPLILGLLLVSLLSLAGGLAAAVGPTQMIAMLTGGDSAETEAPAEGEEHADKDEGHGEAPDAKAGEHGEAAADAGPQLLPFDEMIVNITAISATGRVTSRFLKINLALIYDSGVAGAGQVAERQIYMRDSFQDYLRQLTDRDLQGTLGLVTIKAELLRRARAISGSDAPQEMLVSDLVVQ